MRCARADTAKPPGAGRAPSRSIATRRSEKTGIATSDASGMPSGRSTIRPWSRAMLARAATRRRRPRPARDRQPVAAERPAGDPQASRQRGVDVRAAQRDAPRELIAPLAQADVVHPQAAVVDDADVDVEVAGGLACGPGGRRRTSRPRPARAQPRDRHRHAVGAVDEQFDRWEGGDLDVDPGAVALEVRGEAAARVAGQHELTEDQQRQQDAGEGEQASAHVVTLRDRHTRLGKPKAPRGALFLAAAFLVVVVFTVIGLVLTEFPRHPAETPRVRGIRDPRWARCCSRTAAAARLCGGAVREPGRPCRCCAARR